MRQGAEPWDVADARREWDEAHRPPFEVGVRVVCRDHDGVGTVESIGSDPDTGRLTAGVYYADVESEVDFPDPTEEPVSVRLATDEEVARDRAHWHIRNRAREVAYAMEQGGMTEEDEPLVAKFAGNSIPDEYCGLCNDLQRISDRLFAIADMVGVKASEFERSDREVAARR